MTVLKVTITLTLVAICSSLPFSPRDIQTVLRNQNGLRILSELQNRTENKDNGECKHDGYKVSCCQHLEVDEVGLNSTVCVVLAYLPTDYGVSVTITVDGKVIIQKEVSARNPPAICAAVPYLKKYASICLRFYNLDLSSSVFSGCLKIQIKLALVMVESFNIGCFKIPLVKEQDMFRQNRIIVGNDQAIKATDRLEEHLITDGTNQEAKKPKRINGNLLPNYGTNWAIKEGERLRKQIMADRTDQAIKRTGTVKEDILDHFGIKKNNVSWKDISVIST